MSVNFFELACQDLTNASQFGICDDIPGHRAYIDAADNTKWIAIVNNSNEYDVTFTAIDNCISILRPDGTMDSRCDGMLTFINTIIFVELKERTVANKVWVAKGESQLRNMITKFSANHNISLYSIRKAYVANSMKPLFQVGQQARMQKFLDDTGVTLIIQNVIDL